MSPSSHVRSARAPEYVPRRPHETVLYRLVQEHLATFLQYAEHTYAAPLPAYVVDTFESYLVCGDLSQGFVRCHCNDCGHDVLVAFSCKRRGLCPSCGARRMCNEAANITDRVLPNVPDRPWVMSLPWELRGLAAARPKVLGAMDRIFAEEIGRMSKKLTKVAGSRTGSVAAVQLFGGALNLHPHLHALQVDGAFTKVGAGVRFHEATPPAKDDAAEVAQRVRDRAVRWLSRHGFINERAAEERGNQPAEPSALEGCMQLALAGGTFLARPAEAKPDPDADLDNKGRRFSATCDGFDVHCAVRIAAEDDEGRERLVRYCTRPPLSLDRIELLRDGRIAYRLKTPRRGRTHRVMAPMELMARLAALIPHPRIPQIRYHGVFASSCSWRPLVTPKPPPNASPQQPCAAAATASTPSPLPAPVPPVPEPPVEPPAFEPWVFEGSGVATPTSHPWMFREKPTEPSAVVEPTVISVKHWGRLGEGELLATSRYVDRPTLMKRSWEIDVMKCPACGHRMRVLATIREPEVVKKILDHLGVRTSPLPRATARAPTWEQQAFDDEAA